MTVEEYSGKLRNKRVAVLGIGVSNVPLIRFLCEAGASVTAFDRAEKAALTDRMEQLKSFCVEYCLGEGYLDRLRGFDFVFKTPFVRPDIPELSEERERGAIITSEMEAFMELCPSTMIGVTGSDGKTTTATIIFEMLKTHGYNCRLGGNIGRPLLEDVRKIAPTDMTVLELSSFQLQTIKKSPDVAVITNLSPNHLDFHKSYEEYVLSKKNILAFQGKGDLCVLNCDNLDTRRLIPETRGRVGLFGKMLSDAECAYYSVGSVEMTAAVVDGKITLRRQGREDECVIDADDILIPGQHNVENYLAAICAVERYVDTPCVCRVARGFRGVEHRIEFVRSFDGVRYYNDSIASSPNRTIACLKTFQEKIILIAGGKDKNLDYTPIGRYLSEKVKLLILCGPTSGKLKGALYDYCELSGTLCETEVCECDSFESAVMCARSKAKVRDVVALSPASTSFDRFSNFEERGRAYKELVNSFK